MKFKDALAVITLCSNCGCMTHTIKNKCGKCGAKKEAGK